MINQHLTDIIWYTNEHIKVRNACFFQSNHFKGGARTWMLKMGSCLWSSVGSAVTKCPDFELCVHVEVPSPWLRRPAESLHCPLVVKEIPFIKFLHCALKTGLSSSQHVCEDVHVIREERQDAAAQEVSVLSPVPLSHWLMAPFTLDGVGRQIKALDSGRTLSRKGTGLGCLLDLLNSEVTSLEHLEMF